MTSTHESPEFIGILPAAGIASRLRPSRYIKELLPVAYLVDDQTATAHPVPVISLSLRQLRDAGVHRAVVTVSDRKPELMRYLGDGSEFGLNLGYVQQTSPTGLTAAVDEAYEWVRGCYSCLLLPDTIVRPASAMLELRRAMLEQPCDVVLGVFPTLVPEQLGPVRFDSTGRVLEVLDKPPSTDIFNTWAMAIWSPAFTEFLHKIAAEPTEANYVLGGIFNCAVQAGMSVRAVSFQEGSFIDTGTVRGLSQMLEVSRTLEMPQNFSPAVAGD